MKERALRTETIGSSLLSEQSRWDSLRTAMKITASLQLFLTVLNYFQLTANYRRINRLFVGHSLIGVTAQCLTHNGNHCFETRVRYKWLKVKIHFNLYPVLGHKRTDYIIGKPSDWKQIVISMEKKSKRVEQIINSFKFWLKFIEIFNLGSDLGQHSNVNQKTVASNLCKQYCIWIRNEFQWMSEFVIIREKI